MTIGTGFTPAAPEVTAPLLTLPVSGGAIRGIGETFGADSFTGTASMTVPVVTSPGRGGFGPSLALSYGSGQGNGPFGIGWSMPVPAVTRRTDRGLPRYDDTDTFLFPGAEDLVPVLEPDGAGGWRRPAPAEPPHASGYRVDRYRPRTEGAFTRIERWTRLAAGAGRRAIRRSRMRYRADDLSGPLPLGTAGALALPYRTDQLALTDGLVGAVLRRDGIALLPDPAAVLGGECGYLDEDGQWWAPSGQAIYGPNGAGDFYLPTGFTDPFGNTTTVTHDRYRLLPIAVTDPFGNVVTAVNDYRVLAPARLTDPNGAVSEAVFDALGLVAATARRGRPGDARGSAVDGTEPDLDAATVAAYLDDPLGAGPALLGGRAPGTALGGLRLDDREQQGPARAAVRAVLHPHPPVRSRRCDRGEPDRLL